MHEKMDDIPVKVGIVYEGERIRGPETFIELGGGKVDYKFELVQVKEKKEVEDGKITLLGKDIPDFNEGDKIAFGVLVEVYGDGLEKDLEPVIERRIHDFLNYIQGLMHLNQRYDIWCRISKDAKEAGLRFEHVGKTLANLMKTEFTFIDGIQVTLITDEKKVKELYDSAVEVYEERDARVRGMKDADVDEFYGCLLCQSFAPNHLCIISPERASLCGAISWIDARAAARVDPGGPIFAIEKGEVLDEVKGEFSGVNDIVKEKSNQANDRFYMYSMFGFPHTSCGCFEAIAFYIPEVDGIGIVDRHYTDNTVNGLKFSMMATESGGGEQVEGFLGFGIQWMYSEKFFSGDGGYNRIAWMPSHIKKRMKEAIPKDMFGKIPTEKDVLNIQELKAFLEEKGHPLATAKFEVTDEIKNKAIEYILERDGEVYPEEAAKQLGITEDQFMQIIEKLQEEGVLG